MLPKQVKIVEVGPRDGLQNEKTLLDSEVKIEFINKLSKTGLKNIETGSFVSAKSIPQMHDTDKVLSKINKNKGINYSVLVPNLIGMEGATNYKPDSIAVFTSVSEAFCQHNINCSVSESKKRFAEVLAAARNINMPVRGYISCVLGCPYQGETNIAQVADLSYELFDMGCYEVSLGDTIGVGNIYQVQELITKVSSKIDINKIAVHFHDTYGQALVNVYAALLMGVSIVDSAVAGIGGCPYAKGSSGNLATEDLLYMLNGLNITTNVDLDKIIEAGLYITDKLNILPRSKVSLAKLGIEDKVKFNMQDKKLWQNSQNSIENSKLFKFIKYISHKYNKNFDDYHDFYQWSIDSPVDFWQEFLDYSKIILHDKPNMIFKSDKVFNQNKWFYKAKLNFAENLLESAFNKSRLQQNPNYIALISTNEQAGTKNYTIADIKQQVVNLANYLKSSGVTKGDRVVGLLPNITESVIAMLATTSLGAVWSACSPDFGEAGILERFTQIEPKVILVVDGYHYKNKYFDCFDKNIKVITKLVNSLVSVITIDYATNNASMLNFASSSSGLLTGSSIMTEPDIISYKEIQSIKNNMDDFEYVSVDFNDPVYIMFSSGTTGRPKCIVHGVGGILIEHFKEHLLHHDVKSTDIFFYFTTTSWMMWHWLVSAIGLGSTLVLYDGAPNYPNDDSLINLIDKYNISIFGASAKYFSSLEKGNITPNKTNKLLNLRMILSTGSPLLDEQFDYIYNNFKQDVALCSISGGTDIIGCFALGNILLPIYVGQLQCRSLGININFFDEQGKEILTDKGELVCLSPFPSMPLYFWNDTKGEKYSDAYFNKYNNIWAHGDYGKLTKQNGVVIYGRSDAVLNPGGVRIGTAEIYAQVEKISEVVESLAIGQEYDNDERIILFVVLQDKVILDKELKLKIKSVIKEGATPRHVPSVIIHVPELPRTSSGKLVELAVKNIIAGKEIRNKNALANPDALKYFVDLEELR